MYIENEGRVDRGLRLVGAGTLLVMAATGSPLGFVGLYPLATAVFGYDPLYAALGVDTRFSLIEVVTGGPLPTDGPSAGISMAITTLTGGLGEAVANEQAVAVPLRRRSGASH